MMSESPDLRYGLPLPTDGEWDEPHLQLELVEGAEEASRDGCSSRTLLLDGTSPALLRWE
jgi:hypothetical protein